MSSEVDQIEAGFKRLFNHVSTSFIATVIEDKDDNVDVKDLSGTKYLEVRKIATAGKKGMLFKLPVDSFVLVSRISQSDELYVSMMSEIEGIFIKVGDTTIDITDEIVMNSGAHGMMNIVDFTTKINALVQTVNTLITSYNAHTHITTATVGASAVPGVNAPIATPAQTADPFNKSDYENTKIKH